MLLSDRLQLRRFTMDDLDALAKIRGDAGVMRFIGDGRARTREQVRAAIERSLAMWEQEGFGRWGVIDRAENRLVGWCGLSLLDTTREIELGYGLAQSAWGRGFATEAGYASIRFGFETLHLERIVAVAFPENRGSTRVMEKLGMRFVGYGAYYGAEKLARYELTAADLVPTAGRYELIDEDRNG